MKRSSGLLAVAASVAVTVGACGSGGGTSSAGSAGAAGPSGTPLSISSSTTPATWKAPDPGETLQCTGKAPNPAQGITATSIRVGGIGTMTNAGTSTYQETAKGAAARFARENAAGGVHGRTIDFIGMMDDANSAQQNADVGRKLAENEKVFAVAPVTTVFANYADTLCQAVVPAVGYAFNTGMCNRANTFGFTGCLLPDKWKGATVGPFVQLLKDSPDKSVVLLGTDTAVGKEGVENYRNPFDRAGLKVVKVNTTAQYGQPPADPSALVRQIMTANNGKPPAMVYHVTDFVNVTALSQTLTAAGYKGIQISAVGYDPRITGLKALDGT
jgi:ABC-type branched-subunit amino acid transport system substrate-binding protein